ncbi:hypothetical protein NRIC_38170 [Enterococcus florum]|uniref:NlpC/P60 domain-containing protein n=1 Tax=Enterococcus florum TaxID=2480627 RepID=A0A4P5PDC5_9ENTE|nr:peptidoglycan amidohydrolase family protein [Enterococcus florum]GCF95926.1 hypothetical protein NRIC_38170 [Enterococcus florum]
MGDINKMIQWMKSREGKVSYSMTTRYGPNSFDCSSSVYYALMAGGFIPSGTPGNTESLYRLEGSLLQPISRGQAAKGDIFVSGVKGGSAGSNGHTGIFLDNQTIIHCTYAPAYGKNGICTTPAQGWMGDYSGLPVYYYRLKGAKEEPKLPGKNPAMSVSKLINYETHVAEVGWMNNVADGALSGSIGYSLPIEALKISFGNKHVDGSVEYRVHMSKKGWQPWVKSGQIAGSTGQSIGLEAFEVKLTGQAANYYDIEYQAHVQRKGWLPVVKNGQTAGTTGESLRLEALKINLKRKKIVQGTKDLPKTGVAYRSHLQTEGWLGFVKEGAVSGTTGLSISMECLEVFVNGSKNDFQLDTHCSTIGWMNNAGGTTGQKKNLEAFRITLKNNLAKTHTIEYRSHVKSIGWQGWVRNGAVSGTTGKKLAIEAVQIRLVKR